MNDRKTRVLFLSTVNAARSQMAEAYLRHYAGDRYDVHSAGLDPEGVNPLAAQVMAEAGVPLTGQESLGVKPYLGKMHFGWLITVCSNAEQNCPTAFLGISNRAYWGDIDDPNKVAGSESEKLAAMRATRDEIDRRVRGWLEAQA
jgi:arsenate reductase